MPAETMTFRNGEATAVVSCDGGRLASLRVGDLELLVTEGDKPSRFGSFPMVPWCGRLAGGQLEHGNTVWEMPLTSPPHANHGRAYLQPWRAVDEQTIRTELVEPWPFDGHVLQRFALADDALVITLEVHAERQAMPAMAGWHPWFRRQLARGEPAELTFEAGAHYLVNEHEIPTGEQAPPPPAPWNACFVDVTSGPRITWPGALQLDVQSTFDHWVVFTEPEHALCIEPQSGPPNGLNAAPRMLQPGEVLEGSMTLRWSAPSP